MSLPSVNAQNIQQILTPDSSPARINTIAPSSDPKPIFYDQDGFRYTAAPGDYTGQSPANVFCEGGNKPPCACVTQELKDYILNNGLCKVTSTPKAIQIKGLSSVYSVYTGMPEGTFKWYDKWITSTDSFNPCYVMQLPVCRADCNPPWDEPKRIDPNYGYCKSTRAQQTYSVYAPKPVQSVYTVYAPVAKVIPTCPKGSHPSSGGCAKDVESGGAPATTTASSGYLTGGLLLLLIAAGGGAYYLSQKKGKK
jgi:hypothetical protein